jgi:DNA polymerase IIIc chi subunit
MTEIAFHFNATDKNHYVCRLLRKVWRMQQRVIVCVPDERHLNQRVFYRIAIATMNPNC